MMSTDPQVPEEEALGFNILQCKECRNIIGDTSSLRVFNKETCFMTLLSTTYLDANGLLRIFLEKSDNVIVDSQLETSKGEFDYGNTFNNLHCKNCNEVIGRTYRTTTPELDNIRGHFSYNVNSLIL